MTVLLAADVPRVQRGVLAKGLARRRDVELLETSSEVFDSFLDGDDDVIIVQRAPRLAPLLDWLGYRDEAEWRDDVGERVCVVTTDWASLLLSSSARPDPRPDAVWPRPEGATEEEQVREEEEEEGEAAEVADALRDTLAPPPAVRADVVSPNAPAREATPTGSGPAASPSRANERILESLETMLSFHRNTGNTWRILAYERAIKSIRAVREPLTSIDDVKALPGVGASIVSKIRDLFDNGRMDAAELVRTDPRQAALGLFTRIYGAGPTAAAKWFDHGMRTLDDLREHPEYMTRTQRIGLQYLDDIEQRIPRAEVGEIEAVVRAAVDAVAPGVQVTIAGSYRRGRPTCGDVDVLLTDGAGGSASNLLPVILDRLCNQGFITETLLSASRERPNFQGLCRLDRPGALHRRIDFKAYSPDVFPLALLYFTGSATHNRSMRLHADRTGFQLNDKQLTRLNSGHLPQVVDCRSERDVYAALGLEFCEPTEREGDVKRVQ